MNTASRIIINLFFPELADKLASLSPRGGIALSPFIEHDRGDISGLSLMGTLCIRKGADKHTISLYHTIQDQNQLSRIVSLVADSAPVAQTLMRIITKQMFTLSFSTGTPAGEDGPSHPLYRVDLLFSPAKNEECTIAFVFGNSLLQLFSPAGISKRSLLFLENDILHFFSAPYHLFPRLGPLVHALGENDLQSLLYALISGNLLSPYQITLLLSFLPGMILRFRHTLPSKIFQDAVEIKKRMETASRITRRDISGGVYSIEEAIYHLFSKEQKISISRPLLEMKKLLALASSLELFREKDFSLWLEAMKADTLLHKTISVSGENTTVRALSGDPVSFLNVLSGVLPVARIKELLSMSESVRPSPFDRIMSQLKIINNYRRLKVSRFKNRPDICEYLVMCFDKPEDYTRLVFEAGWYAVSTAAKGFKKRTVDRLLQGLYPPARFLIEDVLNGTVNPNILHDEMQVHRAQEICVAHILSLYEGGFINLSV